MLKSLKFFLEPHALEPIHAHETDAGYDLCTPGYVMILAHKRAVVDTGVHFDIPKGYYGRIETKSGLMKNKGITTRGTIDSGYRGSIKVVVFNHSDQNVVFDTGDKIAQIVFLKCETPKLKLVESFEGTTERNDQGFGSTGK